MRVLIPTAIVATLFAALPASAIYVEGETPPDQVPIDLVLELRDGPDGPEFELVEGTLDDLVAGRPLNITVRNQLDRDVEFVLRTDGHVDDPVDDQGNYTERSSEEILRAAIAASQEAASNNESRIPDNAAGLSFVALDGADEAARLDAQVLHVMYMTGLPEDEEQQGNLDDEGPGAGAEDLDDDAEEDDKKDTPFVGVALLVGALALVVGFRRYK